MFLMRTLLSCSLVVVGIFLMVVTNAPRIEAHSWAACVDWRFNPGVSAKTPGAFATGKGQCHGYARRFPFQKPWGTLDSDDPSRHFQQKHIPNPPACSNGHNGGEPSGANEQKGSPISSAYHSSSGANAKFGPMTVTKKGSPLCLHWPAKNHAVPDEPERFVFIRMIPSDKEKKNGLQSEFGDPIAKMPFKNCLKKGNTDKWFCGGCFTLPSTISPGLWTLQWRWLLNPPMEYYTSCADVQITN